MIDRPLMNYLVLDDGREITVTLTPRDIAYIIGQAVGREVSTATYWLKASIELPAGDPPPLGVQLVATRRE